MQITDEGRRLHPQIRSMLEEVYDLEISHENRPINGSLVIGATSMIAEMSLPKLCVEFMKLHPQVRIRIEIKSVTTLISQLASLELGVALMEALPDLEDIELIPWQIDELVLVVATNHPLATGERLQMQTTLAATGLTRAADRAASSAKWILPPTPAAWIPCLKGSKSSTATPTSLNPRICGRRMLRPA